MLAVTRGSSFSVASKAYCIYARTGEAPSHYRRDKRFRFGDSEHGVRCIFGVFV
jgi:hypothetical protein